MKKSGILIGGICVWALSLAGCAYKSDGCEQSSNKRVQAHQCAQTKSQCIPCNEQLKKSQVKQDRRPLLERIEEKKLEVTLPKSTPVLKCNQKLTVRVTGQGVAPCNGACSPAQAFALAKRAAIADAYRLMAEKVSGVYVEGRDYVKNMAVKSTLVRTYVSACVKNANIVETTFKDGLCEVEMEITLSYADLALL